MEIIEVPGNIRPYTFENFFALEKFVAEIEVANKIAMLDKMED